MPRTTRNNVVLAAAEPAERAARQRQRLVSAVGRRPVNISRYYPECKPEAKHIEGYVAFWKGAKVK
jgi:hypothetical protein